MTAASAGLLWAASYPITCPKRSAQLGTPENPSAEHANSRASSDNGKLKNNIGRMRTAAPGKRDTVYKFHRSKSSHTHTWPCLTVPTPGLERVGNLLHSAEVYRTPVRTLVSGEQFTSSTLCSAGLECTAQEAELSEPRAPGPGSGQVQRSHVLSSRSFDPHLQMVGLRTTGNLSRVLT